MAWSWSARDHDIAAEGEVPDDGEVAAVAAGGSVTVLVCVAGVATALAVESVAGEVAAVAAGGSVTVLVWPGGTSGTPEADDA